jgi:hypothetical protein
MRLLPRGSGKLVWVGLCMTLGVSAVVAVGSGRAADAATALYPNIKAACEANGGTSYTESPVGDGQVDIARCAGLASGGINGGLAAAGAAVGAMRAVFALDLGVAPCGSGSAALPTGGWDASVVGCRVLVSVSGSQTAGSGSPSFTGSVSPFFLANLVTGSPSCSTVGEGVPIGPALAAGRYTIDGSSCSGVTSTLGNTLVRYVGVPDGFEVFGRPQVTTPSSVSAEAGPGVCSAAVANPVTVSGTPAPTVTYNGTSQWPASFPVGTTSVAVRAENPGGSATVTVLVVVADTQVPTLGAVTNREVDATSPAGAVVTYPAPTFSDNCPGARSTATPASGSTFPIGITTVTVTATDSAMLTSTRTFTIRVRGASEQLDALRATVVSRGPGRSLVGKIDEARASLARGDVAGVRSALRDFIDAVNAQAGKSIPRPTATTLVASATRILAVVGPAPRSR